MDAEIRRWERAVIASPFDDYSKVQLLSACLRRGCCRPIASFKFEEWFGRLLDIRCSADGVTVVLCAYHGDVLRDARVKGFEMIDDWEQLLK